MRPWSRALRRRRRIPLRAAVRLRSRDPRRADPVRRPAGRHLLGRRPRRLRHCRMRRSSARSGRAHRAEQPVRPAAGVHHRQRGRLRPGRGRGRALPGPLFGPVRGRAAGRRGPPAAHSWQRAGRRGALAGRRNACLALARGADRRHARGADLLEPHHHPCRAVPGRGPVLGPAGQGGVGLVEHGRPGRPGRAAHGHCAHAPADRLRRRRRAAIPADRRRAGTPTRTRKPPGRISTSPARSRRSTCRRWCNTAGNAASACSCG